MKTKKEILYPIFLSCVSFTTDIFWKHIFEDLSTGKTPYGTYIHNNFLICKYKDKEFSYNIDSSDIEKLYTDIYTLLTEKAGIFSSTEKIMKKLLFYSHESATKEINSKWDTIKKKNIKNMLIERFIILNKKKFDLTINQIKYLLSVIKISTIFKTITNSDIRYIENEVTGINGISFSKNKIHIDPVIFSYDKKTSDKKKSPQTFDYKWEKFLDDLLKKQSIAESIV